MCHIVALIVALSVTVVSCKHKPEAEELSSADRLEILDIKLEKHPKDASLLAERAMVLLEMGRAKEAAFDIKRAVELEPDNVEYRLRQADVNFATGEIESSYKTLSEAERLDPDNMEVQLKMGEVMFYSRDYDRALECLTKVTAKDGNNRPALFMKAFIYKEKGDTASAVTLLRKVCDIEPDYAPAFEELGVLYSLHNNPLAVDYLATALKLEPTNTNTIYALAMYYQNTGNMDQAEALYKQLLEINPNSADAWHNMGYIELTHYHDYGRAIEYFDKAIEADPSHEAAIANKQLAINAANN